MDEWMGINTPDPSVLTALPPICLLPFLIPHPSSLIPLKIALAYQQFLSHTFSNLL